MPRYEDRGGGQTRVYVGRLSTRTRSRDLEDLFSRYGRVRDVDLKHDFAFIEFSDARDADEAVRYLNGKDFEGNRLVVEFARRGPRGPGGSREYLGRGPPPGTGRCYNCGNDGHWARDCKAGDWRDKCYRCGQRGHIERNCRNSPRSLNRYERRTSPSRFNPERSRSRSPRRGRSRSRSYSRSRSFSPRKSRRSPAKEETRERKTSQSRSMSPAAPPRKESRSRSPSPMQDEAMNGRKSSRSPPPTRDEASRSPSPKDRSSPGRVVEEEDGQDEKPLNSPERQESPRRQSRSRSPSAE